MAAPIDEPTRTTRRSPKGLPSNQSQIERARQETVHPSDRRFFIVHLQKTAGTTLRDRFRHSLPETAIYPNRTDGTDKRISVISLSHLLSRWDVRRDEIRLVAGHFPLSTIELLDAEFVTLSVLRSPLDRTLSYLRHQRKLNTVDRERPLEEIYADPFRFNGLIRNHMTRMFGIGATEMKAGDGVLTNIEDSDALLERAKLGVASLDAFGLQPHFEEFWQSLAHRFGLDATACTSSNTTELEPATASLEQRILEDNTLDTSLFEFAENLYNERARGE